MTVNLYSMLSDENVLAKVKTGEITKSVELKGDCSITNPVMILTGDAGDYALINYMYVPDFNRYYYVTCRALPGGLIEVTGRVDVLCSCAPYLAQTPCVVRRQENDWNLYLNDGTFKAYANDKIVTKKFPAGFSNPSYVLVLAGG